MTRALLAGLAILAASAATAADATGEWMRDDGAAKIRFSTCGGDALCGFIAWKKDPKGSGKIGEQVFFDMKPNGPIPGPDPRIIPRTASATPAS